MVYYVKDSSALRSSDKRMWEKQHWARGIEVILGHPEEGGTPERPNPAMELEGSPLAHQLSGTLALSQGPSKLVPLVSSAAAINKLLYVWWLN